jgi:hypothetical protein
VAFDIGFVEAGLVDVGFVDARAEQTFADDPSRR